MKIDRAQQHEFEKRERKGKENRLHRKNLRKSNPIRMRYSLIRVAQAHPTLNLRGQAK